VYWEPCETVTILLSVGDIAFNVNSADYVLTLLMIALLAATLNR
jgi:hypothetical protein